MGAVGFYLFYVLNWIVTLLPLRILYLFSDILFLFLYYFPGYRRKIVATNLKNAFPQKTKKELARIEKKFYHHLSDQFIEIFKLTHLSKNQAFKRFMLTDTNLLNRLFSEDRDVVAVLGHYANWEWLSVSLPFFTNLKTVSIYKPLKNKYFDKYMTNMRSKYGFVMTPMSNVLREIINNRKKNIRSMYAVITDQTPPEGDIKFWINFLNQDTPVYLGAEKIAEKYDMAVVFFNVQKIKRGYYTLTPELLFEHSKGLPEHLITETHVRRLEEIICEKPEYWMWSHRRWKYKREHSDG